MQLLTKELKLQTTTSGGTKLRLSTNHLRHFGFHPGCRLAIKPQTGRFDIIPSMAPSALWKVHERNYRRARTTSEAIIDIQTHALLKTLLPLNTERLHFTLQPNRIEVRPIAAHLFHIRKAFRKDPQIHPRCFLAMSSGLDGISLAEHGFHIDAVLEWRPQEARDIAAGRDLTETGIATVLANHQPQWVFNEDITTANLPQIARLTTKDKPVAVLSIGLQCDDFSNAKSANLKRLEISEFRPSSRELGYYATKLIEELQPATVLIENVPPWHGSQAQGILGAVLTRLGYHVQAQILNAADFGGLTERRRCILVASVWPGFQFPSPTKRNLTPLGNLLDASRWRNVTTNQAVKDAPASGRARFCTLDRATAPTVLKSQARLTKDALFFQKDDGTLWAPDTSTLKKLHGLNHANLGHLPDDIAIEQIGQGIDHHLHLAIAAQLSQHLRANAPLPQQQLKFF